MSKLTQEDVERWITEVSTGKFHYTKVLEGQVLPELYPHLRVIMHRAVENEIAKPLGEKERDGLYIKVNKSLEEIQWWHSDGDRAQDLLLLPLGLHEYGYIDEGAVILVAGVYNQGKTAFCLNVVNLNIEKWPNTYLFASEGINQLSWKFRQMHPAVPMPPPFVVYKRFDNFADVIVPTALNVIDYLRTDMEQSYAVSNKISEIQKKLTTGIAVIAMQKPVGRKIAFGGGATAWEPTMYISIDKGYMEFEKIKAPKQMDFDPYRAKWHFTISKGVNFIKGDMIVE